MNYYIIYQSLVERGKNRSLGEAYKETHHIIPKCMGGSDDKDNLVDLTPEEHFIAHQLLVKIYPKEYGLVKAIQYMVTNNKNRKNKVNNKLYGWLKKKIYQKRKEVKCIRCGKTSIVCKALSKTRKFCSHKCRMDNLKELRKLKQKQCFKTTQCEHCKKDYTLQKWKIKKTRRFCSPKCSYASRTKHKDS